MQKAQIIIQTAKYYNLPLFPATLVHVILMLCIVQKGAIFMLTKTYPKIILLFLLIMISLSLFCGYVLNAASETLQERIYDSIDQNAENMTSQLTTSLTELYQQNRSLVSQQLIRRLGKIDYLYTKYETASMIKQLREQINSIASSNLYVDYVCVYFRNLKKVINSTSYSGGSFHYITPEEYQDILNLCTAGNTVYYTNPIFGQKNLSVFITSIDTQDDFIIELVLSQKAIHQFLSDNFSHDGNHYYARFCEEIVMTDIPETSLDSAKELLPFSSDSFLCSMEERQYYRVAKCLPFIHGEFLCLVATDTYTAPLHTISLLIWYLTFFSILGVILFCAGTWNLLNRPMNKLITGFQQVAQKNFTIQLPPDRAEDFNYIYQSFNSMTASLNRLITQDINQKILLQKAELKQLQSQINPHFLYNSFFLLQSMIKTDRQKESEQMASLLGQYFRYLTRSNMEQVPLAEEYQHAALYAKIQSLRFEGRIRTEIAPLPEPIASLPVPKLILQPLLENAYKHGLDKKLDNGILKMHFDISGSWIYILVEDNSDTLTDEDLGRLKDMLEAADDQEITGLLNIKRRLALFSNYTCMLTVDRSSLGGLLVTIPLMTKSHL